MRAKTIHGFKRGLEPKEAMGTDDAETRKHRDALKLELETLKDRLNRLSSYHPLDDAPMGGTIREARAKIRARIRKIKDELDPTAQDRRIDSEMRAWKKQVAKREVIRKEKKEKLKTLTPKQIAINKLCDLQGHIRMINSNDYFWGHPTQEQIDRKRKELKQIRKEVDEIKKKFNIKSYDIRRQKEYDPQYDDDVNEKLSFKRGVEPSDAMKTSNKFEFMHQEIIKIIKKIEEEEGGEFWDDTIVNLNPEDKKYDQVSVSLYINKIDGKFIQPFYKVGITYSEKDDRIWCLWGSHYQERASNGVPFGVKNLKEARLTIKRWINNIKSEKKQK